VQRQITARLQVGQHEVKTGQPLTATLVVDNPGTALRTTACGVPFAIALANQTYTQQVAWSAVGCTSNHSFTIPHGTTRYELTTPTTYTTCGRDGPSADSPACDPDGSMPPLPPGPYEVQLDQEQPLFPPPVPVAATIDS
jgi:hypothetical protein